MAARSAGNVQRLATVSRPAFGRISAYRRLLNQSQVAALSSQSSSYTRPTLQSLRSAFLPESFQNDTVAPSAVRTLHQGARLGQENKTAAKEIPKEEAASDKGGEETAKEAESDKKGAEGEENTKDKKDGEGEGEKEEKKEAPPPPPPHGDKSPWQVFTETLSSEFKASKEWNESTKALASSAHEFTESESVKRARQAYEASTNKVSSAAGTVLKTTAGAVGKGAAWTWETPVVKGVRSTANAAGTIIEKSTRPIRETEAYKNVKDVIDDGSSSRYGGWVEKEERRKKREARELAENGGVAGKREVPIEDPK
jgi:import inner membrane translocase subunit TIM44